MIDYVDVGMLGFFQDLIPDFTVVMAAPEGSRDILATEKAKEESKNPKPAPRNTVGIPGLSVFRTHWEMDFSRATAPMSHRGKVVGVDEEGNYVSQKWVPIKAYYTVVVHTQHRTDMNYADTEMAHIDSYSNFDIHIPIKDSKERVTFNLPVIISGQPDAKYQVNPDTGKVTWYDTTWKFETHAVLLKTDLLAPIETIIIDYQSILEGEPITLEQLSVVMDL